MKIQLIFSCVVKSKIIKLNTVTVFGITHLWRRRTSPRRTYHASVEANVLITRLLRRRLITRLLRRMYLSHVCGGDVPFSHVKIHDCLLRQVILSHNTRHRGGGYLWRSMWILYCTQINQRVGNTEVYIHWNKVIFKANKDIYL